MTGLLACWPAGRISRGKTSLGLTAAGRSGEAELPTTSQAKNALSPAMALVLENLRGRLLDQPAATKDERS